MRPRRPSLKRSAAAPLRRSGRRRGGPFHRSTGTSFQQTSLKDAADTDDLRVIYRTKTTELNVDTVTRQIRDDLQVAIDQGDLPAVLEHYDDKALFTLAAKSLRDNNVKSFRDWLERVLTSGSQPELVAAIQAALPEIPAE